MSRRRRASLLAWRVISSVADRRHPRRRSDWLTLAASVLACVLMAVAAVGVFVEGGRVSDQGGQLKRLTAQLLVAQRELGTQREQAIEGCERLQILRVDDNVSHFADFRVFRVDYVETVGLLKKHPELIPPAARKFNTALLAQIRSAYRAKTWIPLTDCRQAINRFGVRYRSPTAVPFYKRLPPRSALVVPPSILKQPVAPTG